MQRRIYGLTTTFQFVAPLWKGLQMYLEYLELNFFGKITCAPKSFQNMRIQLGWFDEKIRKYQ